MFLTFRQLRLFLALADTASVSAAARQCHVTQPTASMQLKEITQSIGLPLYEVVSRQVYLTDAGKTLAATARTIGAEWESFEQWLAASKGLTRGKLRIATVSTAEYFIPRLLGTFCSLNPGVDVALEVLNRDGVVRRLRENQDDLYIMSKPPTDMELEDFVLMPNPLVVIASSASRLAKKRRLLMSELKDQRWILREPGSGTRMAADAHFRQHRFKPDIRLELGSNEAIKEAVAGNLGIAVLSSHTLHQKNSEDGVVRLPVDTFPINSQWHLVHRRRKELSPIAKMFMQHLLGAARKDQQRKRQS